MSYDDLTTLKHVYDTINSVRMRNKGEPICASLEVAQENLVDAVSSDIIAWFIKDNTRYDNDGNAISGTVYPVPFAPVPITKG